MWNLSLWQISNWMLQFWKVLVSKVPTLTWWLAWWRASLHGVPFGDRWTELSTHSSRIYRRNRLFPARSASSWLHLGEVRNVVDKSLKMSSSPQMIERFNHCTHLGARLERPSPLTLSSVSSESWIFKPNQNTRHSHLVRRCNSFTPSSLQELPIFDSVIQFLPTPASQGSMPSNCSFTQTTITFVVTCTEKKA